MTNTILSVVSSLTTYPANLYLQHLSVCTVVFLNPVNFKVIKLLNILKIVHLAYDWTSCVIVRVYPFPTVSSTASV